MCWQRPVFWSLRVGGVGGGGLAGQGFLVPVGLASQDQFSGLWGGGGVLTSFIVSGGCNGQFKTTLVGVLASFLAWRCSGQLSVLWGVSLAWLVFYMGGVLACFLVSEGGLLFLIPVGCACQAQDQLCGCVGPFSCLWGVCRPIFWSLEMCWSCFWSLGDSLVRCLFSGVCPWPGQFFLFLGSVLASFLVSGGVVGTHFSDSCGVWLRGPALWLSWTVFLSLGVVQANSPVSGNELAMFLVSRGFTGPLTVLWGVSLAWQFFYISWRFAGQFSGLWSG